MLDPREKARFKLHCRRGMLELDLILNTFCNNRLEHLSPQEIKAFDLLLNCTDPELFSWLMGHEDPQDSELIEIVALIRTSH